MSTKPGAVPCVIPPLKVLVWVVARRIQAHPQWVDVDATIGASALVARKEGLMGPRLATVAA